jgi:hypothetical protein
MIWENYCTATNETALYPSAFSGSDTELAYITLGLIGELGEFGQIVVNQIHGIPSDQLYPELGDCLWYIARISMFSKLKGGKEVTPTLRNCITSSYAESMGKLANSSKKIIRDGCSVDKFIAHVQSAADDLATLYATEFSSAFGSQDEFMRSLDENVLQPNLAKLRSRLKRNAIQGDGDNR